MCLYVNDQMPLTCVMFREKRVTDRYRERERSYLVFVNIHSIGDIVFLFCICFDYLCFTVMFGKGRGPQSFKFFSLLSCWETQL